MVACHSALRHSFSALPHDREGARWPRYNPGPVRMLSQGATPLLLCYPSAPVPTYKSGLKNYVAPVHRCRCYISPPVEVL